MFKINRKLEYALIALQYMNHKGHDVKTTAKEICDTYHTPFDPTSRVLQIMSSRGILHAEQGAHGGYTITKDLSALSMKELSDTLLGPIEIANCLHGEYSQCDINATCGIIGPILNLNENINNLFETIIVADLIESQHEMTDDIKHKKVKNSKPLTAVK